MSLFDELRDYAEGEEPRGSGDQGQIDAALESAALRPALPLRTVGVAAAAAVGSAALIYALWPSNPSSTRGQAPPTAAAESTGSQPIDAALAPDGATLRDGVDVVPVVEADPAPEPAPPTEPDSGVEASPETPKLADPAAPAEKSTPPLNALLERAQAQRAAREHTRARATYRLAIRSYPKEKAAKRALVALGDLELNRLDDSKAALRSYERYIAHGADPVLIQEARYGRIRALRRLGRDGKEREAIEDFSSKHPRSPYQKALKRRLQELDTPLADPTL